MIDLGFTASSKEFQDVMVFSVMSALLDSEFAIDRIYNKLDHTLMICHWPQEKIMQEIRRKASFIYIKMKRGERHSENFILQPFFYHFVVNIAEESVRVFVPENQNEPFDHTTAENPVYAFCYR